MISKALKLAEEDTFLTQQAYFQNKKRSDLQGS
jgi:hypothetical protein